MTEQPHVVGNVISVSGSRLKVELSEEVKAAFRATPHGVQRAIAINSFLTFDLGAGTYVIGVIHNLDSHESYENSRDQDLSLVLTKPRRTASVILLGTVKRLECADWIFENTLNVLPTLDTPAEVVEPSVLSSIFGCPPERNKPLGWTKGEFDAPLEIGHLSGDVNTNVKVSFNDLFSRPLAIVGNTGSGKSYTVASLVRGILQHKNNDSNDDVEPHVFILDINGEYGNAFLDRKNGEYKKEPNKLYLNGEEFCLPAWLMNGEEICEWLQASEATQEPVLKDWWAMVKANQNDSDTHDPLQIAISKIDSALSWLDNPVQPADSSFSLFIDHAAQYTTIVNLQSINDTIRWTAGSDPKWRKVENDRETRCCLENIRSDIIKKIFDQQRDEANSAKSADAPRFVPFQKIQDPKLVDRSDDQEGSKRIDQYLLTLKLRLRTRLDDRRWQTLFSYEDQTIRSYQDWMNKVGVGCSSASGVSILDMSMLASEVLPFVCAVFGRLLLESREMLKPETRNRYPWLIILEEAHNYARPPQLLEERGHTLSRKSFERVAKEGRKFGLSLIVASQRPSEISPTIISQCANFIAHRLQNPDDIDHFRRVIPKQAQGLLDQVTALAAGEAIVFGSALHVATRVQIKRPTREPWSATATPYVDWLEEEKFPLADVTESWGLADSEDEPASVSIDTDSIDPNSDSTQRDDACDIADSNDDDEDVPF